MFLSFYTLTFDWLVTACFLSAKQGDELPNLLNNFDALIAQQWASRNELLGLAYGFSLDSLHPNMDFEEKQLSRQAALMDTFAQTTIANVNARAVPRHL